jgi:hypothetical protein
MKIHSIIFVVFVHLHIQAQIKITSKFLGNAEPQGKGELEVRIAKAHINTFAKYQMEIPQGVRVSESDIKGGNFSIEGNKAKVVWINLPPENEFTIKLKLNFDAQVSFPITLYQKFYYLENSIKKEVSAEPLVIGSSETMVSITTEKSIQSYQLNEKNNTNDIPAISSNNTHEHPSQNNSNNKEVSFPSTVSKSEILKEKNTIPHSEEKYTYKIQIAASAVKPDESTYAHLGKVEIVQHKGMYKVLIDKEFKSKEEALQYREQVIQKGYTGAFLVKYLNGQRVN